MSSSVANAAEAEIWIVPFFGSSKPPFNPEPESRPVCVVIGVMMGWTADVFKNFEVPIVGFFTSDACSAAVECAMWQARIQDAKPGEAHLLLGLPKDVALFQSDLKRRPHGSLPGGPQPL
ncbi:hypothetical protein KPL71_014941 [Citrus sinensis]|uniref:Uncharacterized protein n=2 Tax=Citrus sinensis TaxID=2711 RepID=A0ACB8KF71_CITSI|nr:hypothetical protein KPL71_014941 [Citrus sinensis]KAH9753042.1 hypothetical protein KPL71_014941 [Citrus sinensis]